MQKSAKIKVINKFFIGNATNRLKQGNVLGKSEMLFSLSIIYKNMIYHFYKVKLNYKLKLIRFKILNLEHAIYKSTSVDKRKMVDRNRVDAFKDTILEEKIDSSNPSKSNQNKHIIFL